ncbi:hypothetical protein BH10PLA2_BH10PLA2_12820 [soil metagenome]
MSRRQNGHNHQQCGEYSLRNQFNLVIMIARILGDVTGQIWTVGGTCGVRYLGFSTLLSWLAPIFFLVMFPYDDPCPIFCYWVFTTGVLLWNRVWGVISRMRGYECHDYEMGLNRLELRFGTDGAIAIEVAIGIIGGVAVSWLNPPLGYWLFWSAIGFGISQMSVIERQKAFVRRAKNARYEAAFYSQALDQD